jgi:2-polyprenyl-3-methyl-5-hydroxy-6-metoxy-1,4-benzoquinol methylase
MRAEMELLWEFHEKRLRSGVPPERLTDRLAFSQAPPIRLAECTRCLHIYRNPWERKEALAAAYAGSPPAPGVLEAMYEAQRKTSRRQVARLSRVAGRVGRGLEVGSYAGGFLAAAAAEGWTFEGVDLSEEVSDFARSKGLRVRAGELETLEAAQPYDAIAIWNTFEQLYDARAALVAAAGHLRPGAILALRFPNGTFYRRWRARLHSAFHPLALRLLAHNNLLGFPYRQGFTRASIERLLSRCGFTVMEVVGDTLARVADEWTTGYGACEERWLKRIERRLQPGWSAPWIELYAKAARASAV